MNPQEIWNTLDTTTQVMLVKLSSDIVLTPPETSALQELYDTAKHDMTSADGNGLNHIGSPVAQYGRESAAVTSDHLAYLVNHVVACLDCSPSMVSITYEGHTGGWTVEVKYDAKPNAPSYYGEAGTRSLGDLVGAAVYAIQVVRSGRLRHGGGD